MIEECLWVSVGAVLGANLRFGLVSIAPTWPGSFPIGILFCNILGSFFAGAIFTFSRNHEVSVAVSRGAMVGFLGSLTTFSSFALDSVNLGRISHQMMALNIGLNLAGSIAGVYLGSMACRRFFIS